MFLTLQSIFMKHAYVSVANNCNECSSRLQYFLIKFHPFITFFCDTRRPADVAETTLKKDMKCWTAKLNMKTSTNENTLEGSTFPIVFCSWRQGCYFGRLTKIGLVQKGGKSCDKKLDISMLLLSIIRRRSPILLCSAWCYFRKGNKKGDKMLTSWPKKLAI